jgi:hypothetical protein
MRYCATCFDVSLHLILWIIWQQKFWYLGILLIVVFMIFSVLLYVLMSSYPGAKIDYIKERCLHMVGSLEPRVVLLQVGSNDLCQLNKSVQVIKQKLIGLVLTFKCCYLVQRVAVLQILHRKWPRWRIRYPVDIPWFNDRVDTLNTFLRNYSKEDRVEGVQFWRHSGFWSPENQELVHTDDEVHFNVVHGYTK